MHVKLSNHELVVRELCCGSIAGMVSQAVVYPLDLVRTRLQTSHRHFTSTGNCVYQTFVEEGFRGFYKGLSSPLAAQFLYKSTIFSSTAYAQRRLQTQPGQLCSLPLVFLTAGMAGALNSFWVAPAELMRSRLQVQYAVTSQAALTASNKIVYRGPFDVMRHVMYGNINEQCLNPRITVQGIMRLWTGLAPTLLRDIPGVATWWLGFEWSKRWVFTPGSKISTSGDLLKLSACGAFAGVSYWSVAFPLDTIKSTIQTHANNRVPGDGLLDILRIRVCIERLVSEGGIQRFYRGFGVALLRGIPSSGILFTAHGVLTQLWMENMKRQRTLQL